MKIEITEAKGAAYCRMCNSRYSLYRDSSLSLKGKKCLRIETHNSNGTSIAFYCLKCAAEIKKEFEKLDI